MNTQQLLEQACLVVYCNSSYRVDYCEAEYFMATHELSGDEVQIYYSELDLKRDRIYALQLLNYD